MSFIIDGITEMAKKELKNLSDEYTGKPEFLIKKALDNSAKKMKESTLELYWNFKEDKLEKKLFEYIIYDLKLNKPVNMIANSDEIINRLIKNKIITIKNKKYDTDDILECNKFIEDLKKHFKNQMRELNTNNDNNQKQIMVDFAVSCAEEELNNHNMLIKTNNKQVNNINEINLFINTFPNKKFEEGIDEGNILHLEHFFENKELKNGVTWGDIKSKIDNFVEGLNKDNTYIINLSACYSVAYYIGMRFNLKYGWNNIKLKQFSFNTKRSEIWNNEKTKEDDNYIKFKKISDIYNNKAGRLGVFISVSNKIEESTVREVKNIYSLNHCVSFCFDDEKESRSSIIDGYHATQLVNQIEKFIGKCKYESLHIFIAAPIALMFKLGEESFRFRNVNIYEYIMEKNKYFKLAEIESFDSIG